MKNIKTMLQKRLKAAKNKKGFTLIEIIVVLVIMAVLLALTVPAITSYIEEARNASHFTEARSVYVVAEAERARALATSGTEVTGDFSDEMITNIATKSGVTVTAISYDADAAIYVITLTEATVQVTVNGSMEIVTAP